MNECRASGAMLWILLLSWNNWSSLGNSEWSSLQSPRAAESENARVFVFEHALFGREGDRERERERVVCEYSSLHGSTFVKCA